MTASKAMFFELDFARFLRGRARDGRYNARVGTTASLNVAALKVMASVCSGTLGKGPELRPGSEVARVGVMTCSVVPADDHVRGYSGRAIGTV